MALITPQLAWPLRLVTVDGTTQIAEVEQGSREEILGGLGLACEVRVGRLPWAEAVGIPDPIGTVDPDDAALEIEAALSELETRRPVTVDVVDNEAGHRSIELTLDVEDGEETAHA